MLTTYAILYVTAHYDARLATLLSTIFIEQIEKTNWWIYY